MGRRITRRPVVRVGAGDMARRVDMLAVEEPLEIRVAGRAMHVTMRTPGHDVELAHGLLFSQGVIRQRRDVIEAYRCGGSRSDTTTGGNVLELVLGPDAEPAALTRQQTAFASCGVCGTDSIESVARSVRGDLNADQARLDVSVLATLPDLLRAKQTDFARTGGVHAAGLFAVDGRALCVREDVGRHNAVDKVVGRMLMDDSLPACGTVLMVSGRVSFELVQKAAAAGIPLLAAVSAPSSLAVDLADRLGITLLGFVRGQQANCYTHDWRLVRGAVALTAVAGDPSPRTNTRGSDTVPDTRHPQASQ